MKIATDEELKASGWRYVRTDPPPLDTWVLTHDRGRPQLACLTHSGWRFGISDHVAGLRFPAPYVWRPIELPELPQCIHGFPYDDVSCPDCWAGYG
jgi:hypothetical protein